MMCLSHEMYGAAGLRKQLCVQPLFHVTKVLQRNNAKNEATTGSHQVWQPRPRTLSVAAGLLQILQRFRVRTCT
jgi:hypothetical protein